VAVRARSRTPVVPLLVVLSVAVPASAIETVDEIEDCVRENRPEQTSIQTVAFARTDRTGNQKHSKAKVYWKQFPGELSKALIRVSEPPKSRGTALLLIENEENTDRFLYLPAARKVRRITKSSSSGSLLGTDFSAADLEEWQQMRDGRESKRLDDASVEDRPVWTVQSTPTDPSDSGYERIVSFIDQEKCVALKVEYYARGDKLRKVLTVDAEHVTLESGLHTPRRMTMSDMLEQTSTDMSVEKIEIDVSIRDKVFTRKELAVGRR
jgi:hypothetical protein